MITDALPDDKNAVGIKDMPVSFHPDNRKYAYRPVREHTPVIIEDHSMRDTEHDIMAEL